MPQAYSQKDYARVREEIALERPHVCNNCGTKERLSHSHLVPASRSAKLYTDKANIVYHCLDSSDGKGCHSKFESMEVARMKDFESNFKIIHSLDRQYFWLRIFKLQAYYKGEVDTLVRINNLVRHTEAKESTK